MLNLNDFILLKALYNEQLHNAVLVRDRVYIHAIINERYSDELENGFVRLEAINTERLYKEHTKQLKDEDMLKRMI